MIGVNFWISNEWMMIKITVYENLISNEWINNILQSYQKDIQREKYIENLKYDVIPIWLETYYFNLQPYFFFMKEIYNRVLLITIDI